MHTLEISNNTPISVFMKDQKNHNEPERDDLFYEKLYPLIWNQYSNYEGKHDLSGLYDTIITVTGLTIAFMIFLYDHNKGESIYLWSAMILLLVLIFSLILRIPTIKKIPYITIERYRKAERNHDSLFKEAIDEIYEHVPNIKNKSILDRMFLMMNINLIAFSFFIILASVSALGKSLSIIYYIALNYFLYYQLGFKNSEIKMRFCWFATFFSISVFLLIVWLAIFYLKI